MSARIPLLGLTVVMATLLSSVPALAAPRLLPGAVRKAVGGTASLRVPRGFAGWSEGRIFRVARKKTQESIGQISLTAFPSDAKLEAASPTEILTPLSQEVLAEVEMRHSGLTRLYWEDRESGAVVKLAGGEAGRVVRQAPGRDGTPLTLFVAALRVKGWVYLLGGVWKSADDRRMLPVADTLLRTLRARPPRENVALKKKLRGCWDLIISKKTGKATRGQYVFEEGSAYRYSGEVAIHVGGAEGFGSRDEHGSYRVHGQKVHTRNDHGEPGMIPVRLQGASVSLGGQRYRRCPSPPGEATHDDHDGHDDHDDH